MNVQSLKTYYIKKLGKLTAVGPMGVESQTMRELCESTLTAWVMILANNDDVGVGNADDGDTDEAQSMINCKGMKCGPYSAQKAF